MRIWSLANGKLENTIRLPAGPDQIGVVYGVAMSPDGALVGAGGVMRSSDADRQEQIYLFDRATGTLVKRIEGLPNSVNRIAFSPDGNRLAALMNQGGLRIYAKERNWSEVARDENYEESTYGVDFAPDGRLATTSFDGKMRLYAPILNGVIHPLVTVEAPSGDHTRAIAFSPTDDARIAVGYNRNGALDLVDGQFIVRQSGPNLSGVERFLFSEVAWSRDGETLLAGGFGSELGPIFNGIFTWSDAGTGPRRFLTSVGDTVMALVPLPGNDLLVASGSGLFRLGPDGGRRWVQKL